jgi:hypothetical protein
VRFTRRDGVETWSRDFSGQGFSSLQYAGAGKNRWHVVERFGPLAFALALVPDDRKLRLILRRWTMLGLPMPMLLAPRIEAFEHVVDGRFAFHVDIGLPMIGRLVRYRGTLGEIASPGQRRP